MCQKTDDHIKKKKKRQVKNTHNLEINIHNTHTKSANKKNLIEFNCLQGNHNNSQNRSY